MSIESNLLIPGILIIIPPYQNNNDLPELPIPSPTYCGKYTMDYMGSVSATDTASFFHCIFAVACRGANSELRWFVNTLKLGYNDENAWDEKVCEVIYSQPPGDWSFRRLVIQYSVQSKKFHPVRKRDPVLHK